MSRRGFCGRIAWRGEGLITNSWSFWRRR